MHCASSVAHFDGGIGFIMLGQTYVWCIGLCLFRECLQRTVSTLLQRHGTFSHTNVRGFCLLSLSLVLVQSPAVGGKLTYNDYVINTPGNVNAAPVSLVVTKARISRIPRMMACVVEPIQF